MIRVNTSTHPHASIARLFFFPAMEKWWEEKYKKIPVLFCDSSG
jgi:hypothetical protein